MPRAGPRKADRCPHTLLEISSTFFGISALGHKHLFSNVWGRFAGNAPGFIDDFGHKSLLQSGKREVKSVNDCSTFLDEVWNRPRCPHTLLAFSTPVHLAQPLKDFLSGMLLAGLWGTGDHCSGRCSANLHWKSFHLYTWYMPLKTCLCKRTVNGAHTETLRLKIICSPTTVF